MDTKKGSTFFYLREPIGIAISSPHRKWGIDITDGEEVAIESYYQQFNNLQQILNEL